MLQYHGNLLEAVTWLKRKILLLMVVSTAVAFVIIISFTFEATLSIRPRPNNVTMTEKKPRFTIKTDLSLLTATTKSPFLSFVVQSNEPCRCLETSETSDKEEYDYDGRWFNFSVPHFQLYAYTAHYYDPRSESELNINSSRIILNPPVVRITAEPSGIGFGFRLLNDQATEYVYICPVPSASGRVSGHISGGGVERIRTQLPLAVTLSISHSASENASIVYDVTKRQELLRTSCMPIHVPLGPSNNVTKHDFCQCGPLVFGEPLNTYRIIEWMEMQKLLGVTKVTIYNYNLHPSTSAVWPALDLYVRDGYLEIRPSKPFDFTESRHDFLHASTALNDCLYRHMHICNYIVVVDFDEIIVPSNNSVKTLRQLIDSLPPSTPAPASYAFRNNYFFLDIGAESIGTSGLEIANQSGKSFVYQRFRTAVEISPVGYSSKSIHNPRACSHVHNHYCWGTNVAAVSRPQWMEVKPEFGLNRHYKRCHFSQHECVTMTMSNVTHRDDAMLKYGDALAANIKKTVDRLNNRHV